MRECDVPRQDRDDVRSAQPVQHSGRQSKKVREGLAIPAIAYSPGPEIRARNISLEGAAAAAN
jgi:hypothetical protein